MILLIVVNLAVATAVLFRRFLKHWYFLLQDERRLETVAYVERALEQLLGGTLLPVPPSPRLAEEEFVRRMPRAAPKEQDALKQLFRQWGLLNDCLRRLRQGSSKQRARSALVLGRMQAREALPSLFALLAEENTELRLGALRALELMGDPEAIEPLVKLLPAVKDTAWRLVWAALIACGRPEPERLRTHLAHPEPRVRVVVAAVLGELASPALLDALRAHAGDPDPEVRAKVAWALGCIGSPRAFPLLAERAQDPVWYVRLQAVGALGALGERRAHKLLARAVHDSNLLVRQKAASALYRLWRDPGYLVDFLRQHDPDRYALEALISELEWRGITWEAINGVTSPRRSHRAHSRELVRRLVSLGTYASVLYAVEMHPDTNLRHALLELLAQTLPAERHPELGALLASPYLDAGSRRAIEKLVGSPVEGGDGMD
ncbi:MAG: HEAT repeat domain-containing protein [Terriglobia bacterium]